ncbi:ATP-binding protein [Scytonema hofmannii FACHB-248]|uniref:ATP-binding protein n=1 Tax=Scytonema hofmannii FACHB-248 TaxID=1842502 RepID=A0ABR8GJ61_9CYAN|nr:MULTISPECIES: ATP-binding protein [Nostocales]MBD2603196.1 ATP-binding protein [Scytonema hofmannii FACHB-248]
MGAEEALEFADRLVFVKTGRHLEQPQRIIFSDLWQDRRKTYDKIANSCAYSSVYLKEVGAGLWQLLSEVLGEKITKGSFQSALERLWKQQYGNNSASIEELTNSVRSGIDSNFLGRDREIAELHNIINSGMKLILIQAEGGVGKTTLARKYFKAQNFDFLLELWMATEVQNLTPVESVVEEWLRRDFNEEPGRDFGINLERLRRKLRNQSRKIGVFIDNLETALDKNGKFLESHRRYVELLRVFSDSDVHSVTLVTSRERLRESSIEVHLYPLEGLDQEVWQQFFSSRNINCHSTVLNEMCRAYGGNAKAMQILRGAIFTDFQGDIDAYWQENSTDLLIERELKDLVASQFNRLQQIDLEAYRLLCRLGCYRYQDIRSVPIEGIFCLLWDVPEQQRRRVIKALQDLSLIEAKKGQYWLHPVIRDEAIARLRLVSEEWELVNRKAADFWTKIITEVVNITDALSALEAFYHFIEINDFEQAGGVILYRRDKKQKNTLPLGCSFYQLGLIQKIISVITQIIDNINCQEKRSRLYNILGYSYRLIGRLSTALEYHEESRRIVDKFELNILKISPLFNIGLCKMELWELEEAKFFFNSVCSIVEKTEISYEYIVYSECCLAFINSCLELTEEAFSLAQKVETAMSTTKLTAWGTGYNLLFLCFTYKNLGNIPKSFELCERAILYAEENNFIPVKAKAINCLGELYREQQEFDKSLLHHLESIKMLDKIGAKSDLAEAYYQLALTNQKKGEVNQSRENFESAIALFHEMQAPKQIEKVQTAMDAYR